MGCGRGLPCTFVYPVAMVLTLVAVSAVILTVVWLEARRRERKRQHGRAYRFDDRGRLR